MHLHQGATRSHSCTSNTSTFYFCPVYTALNHETKKCPLFNKLLNLETLGGEFKDYPRGVGLI